MSNREPIDITKVCVVILFLIIIILMLTNVFNGGTLFPQENGQKALEQATKTLEIVN
jgi:hypothetical protein